MSELHKKDFTKIPAPKGRGLEVLPYEQRVERIDVNNWQEPASSSSASDGSAVVQSPYAGAYCQGLETQSASAHSSVPSRDVPDEPRSTDRSVRAARRLINLAGGVIPPPAEAHVVPVEDHGNASGNTINDTESVSGVGPKGTDSVGPYGTDCNTNESEAKGVVDNASPAFRLHGGSDSCSDSVACRLETGPFEDPLPSYFTEFVDHCGSELLEKGEALRLAGVSEGPSFLTAEETQQLRILVRKLKPLFKEALMSVKEDGLPGTHNQCLTRIAGILEDHVVAIISAWRSILPDKAILIKGNEIPNTTAVFAQLADVVLAAYFGLVDPCNTLPGMMTVLSDHNRPPCHQEIKTKESDQCAIVFSAHMPPAVSACLGFYKLPSKMVLVDQLEADAIGNLPLGIVPVVAAGTQPARAPGSKPDCAPRHRVFSTKAYLDGVTTPVTGLEGTSSMRYRDDIVARESTARYFARMLAKTLIVVMGNF